MPSAPVQIVLIGQVSSGKSSLINALLADRQAECDVLPTTREVSRYSLPIPNVRESVLILDTPGYGEAGASAQQQKQIETAVTSADVVLLVMSANTSARKTDQLILEHLETFFTGRPDLKFPHVVGVLSHVDLLKPSLEWKPPYNWQRPTSLKEKNIRAALDYVASIIGPRVSTVIPICTAPESERQWGVQEALFPAIVNALPEAQATSWLRLFENEMKETNWRKVLQDVKQTGQELFSYWRNRSVRSD